VLRRGSLAAAVLAPAFAISAGVVMLPHDHQVLPLSGPGLLRVLPSQLVGVVAAVLAWVVAIVVAERDAARARAHSERASQEALTTLQQALLPTRLGSGQDLTIASRYRAANAAGLIGGDWYDRAILPSGGTALIIGDVEGHDLHAASVMGLVRGAVRSFAMEGHPPAIILERVNSFLLSTGIDRLVTMAYLQLYPDTTMATVALAGHPAPLVIPKVGNIRALDIRGGPILGLEGLADFTEQTVRLPPDGVLVLYTDGLIDFPDASENQQERLIALLASASGGTLADLADLLISSAPPYDDAAVLLARIPVGQEGVARRIFPAQTISASIARGWLADLFVMWGEVGLLLDSGASDSLDVAQLLLTEFVSNAIRHSDHSVTVTARLVTQRLMVDVEDTSERMPVMRDLEDVEAEGRGLRLVDALATQWGVRLVEHGKVVWFQLALPSAAALDTVVQAGTGTDNRPGAMPLLRQAPRRLVALVRESGRPRRPGST
jgi:anti-sigma regulatory factor (Ser/Thr protein kinase)